MATSLKKNGKSLNNSSARRALASKTPRRGPGRPTGASGNVLDRDAIIANAFELTKTVPLAELSVVRAAREFGVTPALVHYYLEGGRDALTSGVMNAFYREIVSKWPAKTGDWRHDLEVVANTVYRAHLRYPGVTLYAASHNRFQLVQEVREGETDYGLLFFEKFMGTSREISFDAKRTAVAAHLLMMFIRSGALATVKLQWLGEHRDLLDAKLTTLDQAAFPNTHFIREAVTQLNGIQMFATGLQRMVTALAVERGAEVDERRPKMAKLGAARVKK